MTQTHDLMKPRYGVQNQTAARLESDLSHLTRTFETLSFSEAAFWAIMGYTVHAWVYSQERGCFVLHHTL